MKYVTYIPFHCNTARGKDKVVEERTAKIMKITEIGRENVYEMYKGI